MWVEGQNLRQKSLTYSILRQIWLYNNHVVLNYKPGLGIISAFYHHIIAFMEPEK